ncbi:MAG: hypothetical protein AABX73_03910, partial [Nanoarchaeota archaeon]
GRAAWSAREAHNLEVVRFKSHPRYPVLKELQERERLVPAENKIYEANPIIVSEPSRFLKILSVLKNHAQFKVLDIIETLF